MKCELIIVAVCACRVCLMSSRGWRSQSSVSWELSVDNEWRLSSIRNHEQRALLFEHLWYFSISATAECRRWRRDRLHYRSCSFVGLGSESL